jgi:hypothetical protein
MHFIEKINYFSFIVYILFLHYIGIRYLRGGTRTDLAIKLADTDLYSSKGGYRDNVPNVLFVLTDGKTNRGSIAYSTVLGPLLVSSAWSFLVLSHTGQNYLMLIG